MIEENKRIMDILRPKPIPTPEEAAQKAAEKIIEAVKQSRINPRIERHLNCSLLNTKD